MTIMASNGFHRIAVVFCGCNSDSLAFQPQVQLLRARLFPASTELPKTAFTFTVLDLLCQISTQGKISAYHFYMGMRNLTDNLDVEGWQVWAFHTPPCATAYADILETLSGAIKRHTSLQALTPFETERSWSRPWWCRIDETRRSCCRLPGMSSTWKEYGGELEWTGTY